MSASGNLHGFRGGIAALPRPHKAMLASLLVAVALANVRQPYPELAWLQHVPTIIVVLAAPLLHRRWPISTASAASLWLFLLLHTLGGRYIYSYVPYDDWARAVFDHGLSDLTGWRRNHYDRLAHFAFGLLCTLPVREGLARRHRIKPRLALVFAFAAVGTASALYEIFEWALTIVAAGDTAYYYNGQQGDPWDAQRDMALAILGSLGAILFARLKRTWTGA